MRKLFKGTMVILLNTCLLLNSMPIYGAHQESEEGIRSMFGAFGKPVPADVPIGILQIALEGAGKLKAAANIPSRYEIALFAATFAHDPANPLRLDAAEKQQRLQNELNAKAREKDQEAAARLHLETNVIPLLQVAAARVPVLEADNRRLDQEKQQAVAALLPITTERDRALAALIPITAERDRAVADLMPLTAAKEAAEREKTRLETVVIPGLQGDNTRLDQERQQAIAAQQSLQLEQDKVKGLLQTLDSRTQKVLQETNQKTAEVARLDAECKKIQVDLQRITTERDDLARQLADVRAQHHQKVQQLGVDHQAEIKRISEAKDDEIQALKAAHQQEVMRLNNDHQQAEQKLADAHAQQLANVQKDDVAARGLLDAQFQADLQKVQQKHALAEQMVKDDHAKALDQKDREHTTALQQLIEEHERKALEAQQHHQQQVDNLQGQLTNSTQELGRVKETLTKTTQERDDLAAANARLASDNSVISRDRDAATDANAKLLKVNATLGNQQTQFEMAAKQLRAALDKVKDGQQRLRTDFVSELSTLKGEYEARILDLQAKALEQTTALNEQLTKERAAFETERQSLTSQLNALQNEHDSKVRELGTVTEQLQAIEQQIGAIRGELQTAKTSLQQTKSSLETEAAAKTLAEEKAQQTLATLQTETQEKSRIQAELETTREALAKVQAEIQSQAQVLATETTTKAAKIQEAETLSARIAALEKELMAVTATKLEEVSQKEAALAELATTQAELRSKKDLIESTLKTMDENEKEFLEKLRVLSTEFSVREGNIKSRIEALENQYNAKLLAQKTAYDEAAAEQLRAFTAALDRGEETVRQIEEARSREARDSFIGQVISEVITSSIETGSQNQLAKQEARYLAGLKKVQEAAHQSLVDTQADLQGNYVTKTAHEEQMAEMRAQLEGRAAEKENQLTQVGQLTTTTSALQKALETKNIEAEEAAKEAAKKIALLTAELEKSRTQLSKTQTELGLVTQERDTLSAANTAMLTEINDLKSKLRVALSDTARLVEEMTALRKQHAADLADSAKKHAEEESALRAAQQIRIEALEAEHQSQMLAQKQSLEAQIQTKDTELAKLEGALKIQERKIGATEAKFREEYKGLQQAQSEAATGFEATIVELQTELETVRKREGETSARAESLTSDIASLEKAKTELVSRLEAEKQDLRQKVKTLETNLVKERDSFAGKKQAYEQIISSLKSKSVEVEKAHVAEIEKLKKENEEKIVAMELKYQLEANDAQEQHRLAMLDLQEKLEAAAAQFESQRLDLETRNSQLMLEQQKLGAQEGELRKEIGALNTQHLQNIEDLKEAFERAQTGKELALLDQHKRLVDAKDQEFAELQESHDEVLKVVQEKEAALARQLETEKRITDQLRKNKVALEKLRETTRQSDEDHAKQLREATENLKIAETALAAAEKDQKLVRGLKAKVDELGGILAELMGLEGNKETLEKLRAQQREGELKGRLRDMASESNLHKDAFQVLVKKYGEAINEVLAQIESVKTKYRQLGLQQKTTANEIHGFVGELGTFYTKHKIDLQDVLAAILSLYNEQKRLVQSTFSSRAPTPRAGTPSSEVSGGEELTASYRKTLEKLQADHAARLQERESQLQAVIAERDELAQTVAHLEEDLEDLHAQYEELHVTQVSLWQNLQGGQLEENDALKEMRSPNKSFEVSEPDQEVLERQLGEIRHQYPQVAAYLAGLEMTLQYTKGSLDPLLWYVQDTLHKLGAVNSTTQLTTPAKRGGSAPQTPRTPRTATLTVEETGNIPLLEILASPNLRVEKPVLMSALEILLKAPDFALPLADQMRKLISAIRTMAALEITRNASRGDIKTQRALERRIASNLQTMEEQVREIEALRAAVADRQDGQAQMEALVQLKAQELENQRLERKIKDEADRRAYEMIKERDNALRLAAQLQRENEEREFQLNHALLSLHATQDFIFSQREIPNGKIDRMGQINTMEAWELFLRNLVSNLEKVSNYLRVAESTIFVEAKLYQGSSGDEPAILQTFLNQLMRWVVGVPLLKEGEAREWEGNLLSTEDISQLKKLLGQEEPILEQLNPSINGYVAQSPFVQHLKDLHAQLEKDQHEIFVGHTYDVLKALSERDSRVHTVPAAPVADLNNPNVLPHLERDHNSQGSRFNIEYHEEDLEDYLNAQQDKVENLLTEGEDLLTKLRDSVSMKQKNIDEILDQLRRKMVGIDRRGDVIDNKIQLYGLLKASMTTLETIKAILGDMLTYPKDALKIAGAKPADFVGSYYERGTRPPKSYQISAAPTEADRKRIVELERLIKIQDAFEDPTFLGGPVEIKDTEDDEEKEAISDDMSYDTPTNEEKAAPFEAAYYPFTDDPEEEEVIDIDAPANRIGSVIGRDSLAVSASDPEFSLRRVFSVDQMGEEELVIPEALKDEDSDWGSSDLEEDDEDSASTTDQKYGEGKMASLVPRVDMSALNPPATGRRVVANFTTTLAPPSSSLVGQTKPNTFTFSAQHTVGTRRSRGPLDYGSPRDGRNSVSSSGTFSTASSMASMILTDQAPPALVPMPSLDGERSPPAQENPAGPLAVFPAKSGNPRVPSSSTRAVLGSL